MTNAAGALDLMTRAWRDGAILLLLLDYDGTLTPLVEHPDLANLDPHRRQMLVSLNDLPRIRVGVISGRSLADVKQRVGIPGLFYAGTGGMEIDLFGEAIRHPDEAKLVRLIDDVTRQLEPVIADWPGAWLEHKVAGVTLHYRDVEPGEHKALLQRVGEVLGSRQRELLRLSGPLAIEILPRAGWHKGSAVELVIERLAGHTTFPCYAGDEANDGHAFDAVKAAGGIAIGVGPQAPDTADYRVPDPAALAALLTALRDALASVPVSGDSPTN